MKTIPQLYYIINQSINNTYTIHFPKGAFAFLMESEEKRPHIFMFKKNYNIFRNCNMNTFDENKFNVLNIKNDQQDYILCLFFYTRFKNNNFSKEIEQNVPILYILCR